MISEGLSDTEPWNTWTFHLSHYFCNLFWIYASYIIYLVFNKRVQSLLWLLL